MVSDPVAAMITSIKNAGMVGHERVSVPFSQFTFAIAKVLEQEGYVTEVAKRGKKVKKYIDITLAQSKDGRPRISDIGRVSKLSRRIYTGYRAIRPYKRGLGMIIFSTPKGVLSDKEARKQKVGGEPLIAVW